MILFKFFNLPVWVAVLCSLVVVEQGLGADQYVGPLSGGPKDARIAAVVDGKQLVAYACSGDSGFNQRYAVWFIGTLDDDGSFAGAVKDTSLKLRVQADAATGQLIYRNGKTFAFKAAKVPEDGIAGLYRAEAGDIHVIGTIIDQEHLSVGSSRNKKTGKAVPLRSSITLPPPDKTGKLTAEDQQQLQARAQQALTFRFPKGIKGPPQGVDAEPSEIVQKRRGVDTEPSSIVQKRRGVDTGPVDVAPKRGVDLEPTDLLQAQRVLNPALLPKGVFVSPGRP